MKTKVTKQKYINQTLSIDGVQVLVDELNTDLELLLIRYNKYLERAKLASKIKVIRRAA